MMRNATLRMILITATVSFAFTGIVSARNLDNEEISGKKTTKAPPAEQKAKKRKTKPAEKPDTADGATRAVTTQSKEAHEDAKKIIDNLK